MRGDNVSLKSYKTGSIPSASLLRKNDVASRLVAIYEVILEDRGYVLITPRTRAVLTNEIHELIITDEMEASPDKIVNHVAVLGFMEVKKGGIIAVGDTVSVKNETLGEIAGFDLTHMPNHLNIIVKAPEFKWPPLNLNDAVTIFTPK